MLLFRQPLNKDQRITNQKNSSPWQFPVTFSGWWSENVTLLRGYISDLPRSGDEVVVTTWITFVLPMIFMICLRGFIHHLVIQSDFFIPELEVT